MSIKGIRKTQHVIVLGKAKEGRESRRMEESTANWFREVKWDKNLLTKIR